MYRRWQVRRAVHVWPGNAVATPLSSTALSRPSFLLFNGAKLLRRTGGGATSQSAALDAALTYQARDILIRIRDYLYHKMMWNKSFSGFSERSQTFMRRRSFLSSLAALTALGISDPNAIRAETVTGELPWVPGTNDLPIPVKKGGLAFLTSAEANTLGALAERLIPGDELSIGALEAGCVTFIDR